MRAKFTLLGALAIAVASVFFAASHEAISRAAVDPGSTLAEGKSIFRDDTFGDQSFWGDTIGLHRAIEGAALGGVGPGVSPKTALSVGLKVDVDRLPPAIVTAIQSGKIDLNSPATTIAC
jgi:hypothetical protein